MKIVFTSTGTDWDSQMDPRFGRTNYLVIYDHDKDELTHIDNTSIVNEEHGAGTKTSALLAGINPDVLITGNGPGGNAAMVLSKTEIKVYTGAGEMTVREAFEAWKKGSLKEFIF